MQNKNQNKNKNYRIFFLYTLRASLILSLFFYFSGFAFFGLKEVRAEEESLPLKIFKQSNLQNAWQEINNLDLIQGANLALGDINLDGKDEIVLGIANRVIFLNQNGQKIYPDLIPFEKEYQGIVDIALADVGGDGFLELVTAKNTVGNGQVKVFNIFYQKELNQFTSFEGLSRGIHIAACDIDKDNQAEIIISAGIGSRSHVRIFKANGTYTNIEYFPYVDNFKGGADVACADIDGDKQNEIITGANRQGTSHIKYFEIGKNEPINSFYSFDEKFLGGVNLSAKDLDQDNKAEVLTGAGPGAEPNIKVFKNWQYNLRFLNFYPYAKSYVYGVNISAGDLDGDGEMELVSAPAVHIGGAKRIEIVLSSQKLKILEGETILGEYQVSTGKRSMPTPQGTFKILNKNSRAYSKKYGLYMPYWMAFTSQGHGIHELPEWPNGYKEGANHLGIPVSHGCVRLGIGPAQKVYNWAEVGMPVIVKK